MFGWRRRQPSETIRVTVYTRINCHLCDEAAHVLERERGALGFSLEYVDVDGDDALRAAHGDWVPVVEVNGKVRFRGRIDPILWRRLMTALRRP